MCFTLGWYLFTKRKKNKCETFPVVFVAFSLLWFNNKSLVWSSLAIIDSWLLDLYMLLRPLFSLCFSLLVPPLLHLIIIVFEYWVQIVYKRDAIMHAWQRFEWLSSVSKKRHCSKQCAHIELRCLTVAGKCLKNLILLGDFCFGIN